MNDRERKEFAEKQAKFFVGVLTEGVPEPTCRTDVQGLTVSTVNTYDEGYETAIVGGNGSAVVERVIQDDRRRSWGTRSGSPGSKEASGSLFIWVAGLFPTERLR